ncbi:MAG: C4-dicarboxylate ABC transporter permease [Chloroflexi bacterium RBG_13_51_52]|nr:MAG: C4-dicarboxylate ABC transporter permease [Chloroflexi bacterium RBG_13_51_52]
MSPIIIGTIGVIILLLCFAIGMPMAFSMALVGTAGFAYLVSPDAAINLLPRDVFDQFASYPLSVIPMFVMMGCYAYASGIGKKLFDAAYVVLGRLSGGLAIASVAACALFGAVSGSTAATTATVGKTALPEMKKHNYSDIFATGTLATAGGLGIMIPPSTAFIVYGLLTEQSIGKLYIAGIIPGIIIAVLFVGTILVWCKIKPNAGPPGPSTTLKQKLKSLTGVADALILFLVTMGGLFAGWFTPTQAGAIGAVGALVIGLVTRELTWAKFIDATKDGLRISCMIMLLIAGATVFSHFITRTTMPMVLADWVNTLSLPPVVIMILILIFYFILGTFLDAMACIVLVVPIIFPMVLNLGYDPIWFGVMVTLLSMIAVVSPPDGVNVYVVKGISRDVPIETIFWGTIPYLVPFFAATVVFVAFPPIVTFLSQFISY